MMRGNMRRTEAARPTDPQRVIASSFNQEIRNKLKEADN
jgi:hypothetical protein